MTTKMIITALAASSLVALKNVEERLDHYRRANDASETFAHRGTQLQLLARLEWLSELAQSL